MSVNINELKKQLKILTKREVEEIILNEIREKLNEKNAIIKNNSVYLTAKPFTDVSRFCNKLNTVLPVDLAPGLIYAHLVEETKLYEKYFAKYGFKITLLEELDESKIEELENDDNLNFDITVFLEEGDMQQDIETQSKEIAL